MGWGWASLLGGDGEELGGWFLLGGRGKIRGGVCYGVGFVFVQKEKTTTKKDEIKKTIIFCHY